MWGLGLAAYFTAVFQRNSLGVAGIAAADRFDVSAAALATLSVLQLLVYAGMQIPTGILLDRFGASRMLVTGAACMAAGQVAFATAHGLGLALLGRFLLGAGDAMTFISVLRIIAVWLPGRINPLATQVTGLVGQAGAIVATVPLVAALHDLGWTRTYLTAAGLAFAVGVVVALLLRDAPSESGRRYVTVRSDGARVRENVRTAWAQPGTRLGMWVHFTAQFPMTVFALLWGYPFLVDGEGLAPSTAGALLLVLVVSSIALGPVMGHLVGRHPYHRSSFVLATVGVTAGAWAVVLAWPGRAPFTLLVVLVLAMGTNMPGSLVGFDFARTFNPTSRFGTASGIVNVGGFAAAVIAILAIGVVLDVVADGGTTVGGSHEVHYGRDALRLAMCTQYGVWALGVFQILRLRARLRATHARDAGSSVDEARS
jgi:sugar phosphate permease